MVLERPQQPKLIVAVFGCDDLALLMVECRPVPVVAVIAANEVAGNSAGVVAVGLALGTSVVMKKPPFCPASIARNNIS
jgi:acyl-CoA reductase-like NAD-dependent aldehyde dehydrogenase